MRQKKYSQNEGVSASKPESHTITEDEAWHYVDILKVRYSHAKHYPENPKQLASENPDIPVRQLTKYITEHWEEDAKKFYIRNHIFKGHPLDWDTFTFFYVTVYPWLNPFWCCAKKAGTNKSWHSEGPQEVQPGDYVKLSGGTWGRVLQIKSCMGIDAPITPTRIHSSPAVRTIKFVYSPLAVQSISASDFQAMVEQQLPQMPDPDMTNYFKADKQILHYLERLSRDKIPFQPDQFRNSKQWDYSLIQIYFQGQATDIYRLRDYLLAQGASNFSLNPITFSNYMHTTYYMSLSADPSELRNIPSVYMDAITLFPVLRVVGLAKHCTTKNTLLFFSESGLGAITHCEDDQTAVQSALKDAMRLGGELDKLYLGFVNAVIPDHGVDYQASQIYWRLKDSNMAMDVQGDIYLKA